jgi:diguanylate cyclase (GGDEF)-like protein/PAS domain S-box-containing protein
MARASGEPEALDEIGGERLRRLVESARLAIIEFDADGRGIFVNEQWRALTGFRGPLPVSADDLLALIHPDDRDDQRVMWEQVLQKGRAASSTVRFQRPDGEVRYVEAHLDTIDDVGNGADAAQRGGHVASLTDVTDRHQAQLDLRTSEERYRRLVDQAPVGQAVVALDGTIGEANQALARIVGAMPSDLRGINVAELIHPDDVERALIMLASQRDGEIDRVQVEVRIIRFDGDITWVRSASSVVRDDNDEPRFIHVVVLDITEQRAAEIRLRESELRYRTMVDSLHDGVLIFAGERIEAANQSAANILGVSLQELIDDPSMLMRGIPIHENGRPFDFEERPGRVAMSSGRPVSDIIMGLEAPGRDLRWVSMNAWPLSDEGEVHGVVVSISDITESKAAADALRASEERYRSLVEHSPIGQIVAGLDGQIIEVNRSLAELMGLTPEEMVGNGMRDLLDPDQRREIFRESTRLLNGQIDRFVTELRYVRPDDREVWTVITTTLLHDSAGAPSHFLTLVQDVTQRRATEEESRRLANIVESTSDLVGLLDFTTGRLRYLNRSARELFGFVDQDVTLVSSLRLYASSSFSLFESEIAPAIKRGESWTGEVEMRRADGTIIPVLQTVTGALTPEGEIAQLWSVGRDITERKRKEVDLAHQATHDPLTDLPNRSLLLDHLELALARAARSRLAVALLFLDLDRFKTVNDNLGHEAGDELLVEVSERIHSVLRPIDTLARLGGDEFVILCDEIDNEHHAVTIAERIATAIESRPFLLSGASLDVTASIGIALANDEHTHPEALLRDADAAMYRAKDQGRARHELFDEAMRRRSAQRHELAEELAEAIDHGEIIVYYQPVIDLETGLVTSVEALARWDHPERGILPPYEFIGVAEETGLIVGLGLAVLTKTCDQVRRWEVELGSRAPQVHVNLSARQLTHTSLPTLVEGVLERSLVDPGRLCLEITESVLMEDAAKSVAALAQLKEIGVDLAIDDFGTGYSSLSYLRRFPVDVLKVDRSFVDGLGPDPHDSSIVAAIVSLAHTLDLVCVAEGVETAEQLAGLRRLDCDSAQGFLFAKPLPVPEVNRHLTATFDLGPVERHPTRRKR